VAERYGDRVEIANPGEPVVPVGRFLSIGPELSSYEGALDVDEGLVADLIRAAEAVRVALRAAGLPPEV
jgi:hypothetical protein